MTALSTLSAPVLAQQTESNAQSKDGIERVSVLGRATQFYRMDESAMATKTPTNFMDIPQSIQVLSEELIEDQAARQTTDLYRSISGVSQFSYSGVTARGFRQDQVRYDGVQGDPYSGFSIPQLFNIERVEVLKGPSSMLYGGGEPGALINYVTKKPEFDDKVETALFLGNYSQKGASVDATGSMSDSSAFRLGTFYQDRETFRKNTDEQNLQLSASATWLVGNRTDLTLQWDHINQDLGGHRLRGVPVDDQGNFLTDISYNANEPGDSQKLKADVLQLISNHMFDNGMTNRTMVRVLDNERTQQYHDNRGLLDDGRSMIREYRDQLRENQEVSLTTDFVYETELGGLQHTLLVGGDAFLVDYHFEYKVGRGESSNVPDLDILNPQYGADPSNYLLTSRPNRDNEFERFGFYIQDQIHFNKEWLGLVGARYDNFKDEVLGGSAYSVSDSQWTPRVGVIYQPTSDTSLFANITQGFNPQSTGSQASAELDSDFGALLEPEESRQYEVGVKNQWLDNRILSTLTAYEITKSNVTLANPADTGFGDGIPSVTQIGEVTSEGIELDVVGDITKNWTGTFNYAYNDTVITGGGDGSIRNSVGSKFANAPEHTVGLWTRFDFPAIASAFSFGMEYVGERISLSDQVVQSYTVWDASWRSEIQGFDLQINVRNLFDKEYASSGFSAHNGHFPGEPRTVLVQLSRTF
ncbi:TonB-dependent siderophore receptor [Saliniradius amylolyticus]|nr:TonB-dependent siderophore receptor [Saliniradius amylolyticus]